MDRREAIRVIEELLADRDNDSRYPCVSSPRHYEALDLAIEALGQTEIVRCKDCKHYNPPHIEYNDGTRKDYPDGFVTVDIGTNVGGKCENSTITMRTYCTAHDRENPDDFEELVIFRNPMEYCSFGEKAEKHQLSGETSTISEMESVEGDAESALPPAEADNDDLIIKGAKGLKDGLYNIKDGKLFKYKTNGGTVRTYPIAPSAVAVQGKPPVSEDCISRQEAVEEIKNATTITGWNKYASQEEIVDDVERQLRRLFVGAIESLPPVTPTEQQEHGRLIDADALLKPIEESWKHAGLHGEDYRKIKKWINNAPTVITPTERTGEWIEKQRVAMYIADLQLSTDSYTEIGQAQYKILEVAFQGIMDMGGDDE